MPYREGDYYVTCDRTGFKILASQARKEWTGALVRRESWEPRHPQDFVRSKRDKMDVNPAPARPEPVAEFMGPLSTTIATAAVAGDTSITVETTLRFFGGDLLRIGLDNKEMFLVEASIITNSTTIYLDKPLPFSSAVGSLVLNLTAISPPELG